MKFTPTHIHTQARDSMPKKKTRFFFDILIFNVTTNMAKRYIQVIFTKNILSLNVKSKRQQATHNNVLTKKKSHAEKLINK